MGAEKSLRSDGIGFSFIFLNKNVSLGLLMCNTFVVSLLIFGGKSIISNLVSIPQEYNKTYLLLLSILLIQNFGAMLCSVCDGFFSGLGRMEFFFKRSGIRLIAIIGCYLFCISFLPFILLVFFVDLLSNILTYIYFRFLNSSLTQGTSIINGAENNLQKVKTDKILFVKINILFVVPFHFS